MAYVQNEEATKCNSETATYGTPTRTHTCCRCRCRGCLQIYSTTFSSMVPDRRDADVTTTTTMLWTSMLWTVVMKSAAFFWWRAVCYFLTAWVSWFPWHFSLVGTGHVGFVACSLFASHYSCVKSKLLPREESSSCYGVNTR